MRSNPKFLKSGTTVIYIAAIAIALSPFLYVLSSGPVVYFLGSIEITVEEPGPFKPTYALYEMSSNKNPAPHVAPHLAQTIYSPLLRAMIQYTAFKPMITAYLYNFWGIRIQKTGSYSTRKRFEAVPMAVTAGLPMYDRST